MSYFKMKYGSPLCESNNENVVDDKMEAVLQLANDCGIQVVEYKGFNNMKVSGETNKLDDFWKKYDDTFQTDIQERLLLSKEQKETEKEVLGESVESKEDLTLESLSKRIDELYHIVNESKKLTESVEFGPELGLSDCLMELIKMELDSISQYNSLIATCNEEKFDNFVPVLQRIAEEKNTFVGNLQGLLTTLNEQAGNIVDGVEEVVSEVNNEVSPA